MTEPVVLESAIREVQVFRKGAVVTRVADLAPGQAGLLALVGLPLCIDDDSVRVAVLADDADAPRPADVRAEAVVPPLGALLEPPSREELKAVERRIADLRHRAEVIDGELGQVDRISLGLPSWEGKEPPRPASAATFEGVLDWTARLRAARLEEREQLGVQLQAAQEELARLERREAEARAARDARADAVSKRVVLRLTAPAPAGATLRLEYRVPGAWWVPSYVLRLARDGRSASLGVRAHVTQRTGEPWTRVRLFLSTADLLRETELPELRSLRIGRRQPPPARRAWREPPTAGEALLEGLQRALTTTARGEPAPMSATEALAYFEAQERAAAPADPFAAPVIEVGYESGEREEDEGFDLTDDDEVDPFGPAAGDVLYGAAPPPARPAPAPPPRMAMASMARMPAAAPLAEAAKRRGGAAPGGAAGRREGAARSGGGSGLLTADGSMSFDDGPLAPDAALLRFGDLAMPAWDDRRAAAGKLRSVTWDDRLADLDPAQRGTVLQRLRAARSEAEGVRGLPLPPLTARVEQSVGAYDHRYDTEGLVDVPSDGALHNVPLLSAQAPVRTTLVVVPRESDEPVRMATLTNPLEAPLLAGPAEVYLEDEFLVTAPLRTVPTGGELTVGLGLEPGLKVARNTFFEEKTTGLLGGGLVLEHKVVVDLASRLAAPAEVEVREVVPVKADDEQAVSVGKEHADPPWELLHRQEDGSVLRGGRRWRLTLKPGEERKLVATYALELDAKNELVGGNRRP
ncbi:MAG: DUF4139 domain-containing protein [Planctomycetes bacterium]|nr:DUF4139 domain-containing protein [Planctomycetota bacterium]